MRIQVVSDLHIDINTELGLEVAQDVDLMLVAGDVAEGAEHGFAFLREQVPARLPIVAVLGNHEFYHRDIGSECRAAREAAAHYDITLLDDTAVEINAVRFIGATLWTDYAVFGRDAIGECMRVAGEWLGDHHLITSSELPFEPLDALARHRHSRGWIERTLARPFDGPTVVATHHAPHVASIAPQYRDTLLTAAFVSDLSALIEAGAPALWVHGHTHTSFDYLAGATRVLCNPFGYGDENPRFAPTLVVEIGG